MTEKLPSLQELGRRVQEARKRENLSQVALAELIGISHVTIVRLEKGEGNLRLENAWKALSALGLVETSPADNT